MSKTIAPLLEIYLQRTKTSMTWPLAVGVCSSYFRPLALQRIIQAGWWGRSGCYGRTVAGG